MKLTKEQALSYHHQMWSDMQRDLGDCPSPSDRVKYKSQWCIEHSFNKLTFYCFLCEYVFRHYNNMACEHCPVVWPDQNCKRDSGWLMMPISELLALPERSYD